MKKFTKVSLIIAAVFVGIGLIFCCIAAGMSGGFTNMYERARAGEFDYAGWHFGDGLYYDGEDTTELGARSDREDSFSAEKITEIEANIDLGDINFEKAQNADEVTVKIEKGYLQYYSCKMNGSVLEITYDTGSHHHNLKGADITVLLPERLELDSMDINTALGDIDLERMKINCSETNLYTALGDVTLSEVTLYGTLDAGTALGNVEVIGGECEYAELESAMGDVKLEGAFKKGVNASTDMGDVKADLYLEENAYNFDLSTDMGDVHLNGSKYSKDMSGSFEKISEGATADVTLNTNMGDVHVTTK